MSFQWTLINSWSIVSLISCYYMNLWPAANWEKSGAINACVACSLARCLGLRCCTIIVTNLTVPLPRLANFALGSCWVRQSRAERASPLLNRKNNPQLFNIQLNHFTLHCCIDSFCKQSCFGSIIVWFNPLRSQSGQHYYYFVSWPSCHAFCNEKGLLCYRKFSAFQSILLVSQFMKPAVVKTVA
jgi:hypothetical protein